ncbi:MAG: trypsin-like peptidase domain-containing protein [Coriobacteriales bacterium]|jgi:S1-C subfamily serine protease
MSEENKGYSPDEQEPGSPDPAPNENADAEGQDQYPGAQQNADVQQESQQDGSDTSGQQQVEQFDNGNGQPDYELPDYGNGNGYFQDPNVNEYGQAPYGSAGQSAYDQTPYGSDAQPAYGQTSYGSDAQPAYGQASYGSDGQQYGSQNPYGQHVWSDSAGSPQQAGNGGFIPEIPEVQNSGSGAASDNYTGSFNHQEAGTDQGSSWTPSEAQVPPTSFPPPVGSEAPIPDPKKKKKHSGIKPFVWGIIGVVVVAVVVFCCMFFLFGGQSSSSSSGSNVTINTTSEDASLAEAVASKCLPSVVSIDVYTESDQSQFDPFGTSSSTDTESNLTETASGSGVIISEDGYILTNYHVVSDGTVYVVHFDDDSSAEATLVGGDTSSDLAVLKVDKTGLTPITVGDSDSVTVGEWTMALGAPFGLTKSVSTGIVSALYRSETLTNSFGTSIYANMIQTDAAINPGNSGGALVDSEGNLIGIVTMLASYSGDYSGVGFAIPSNYAMDIANQLIENGYATHPYLGVKLGTVDAATKDYYNTTADSGAYVGEVVSGSPAEDAGLQVGDVIVSYNGETVTTSSELIIDVRGSNIGDQVELGIIRDGQEITVTVTLGSDEGTSSS